MTDKKNINNSLKNQDKNFNKNSTHENNQIIIDGCNVSGCSYYNPLGNYNCGGTKKCSQWSNCYFKQLARKTQECEELKNTLEKLTRGVVLPAIPEPDVISLTDRYREALEEIEKVCIEDTRIFADGTEVRYDSLDKILDIISKAKGE